MTQQRVPIFDPPNHWRRCSDFKMPNLSEKAVAEVWEHKLIPLRVLRSLSRVKGGGHWLHVSVVSKGRLPTWVEMSKVKNEFIGPDREAYQVLASKADHVNLHEHCLHLWWPIDGVRRVANLQDLEGEEIP